MEIDLAQLPVPDWGLVCPRCGYPLRGLPSHRCPECGRNYHVPSLIRPWTRLRDPRFTGHELPLPDFGLRCARCRAPLAGSTEPACGQCGTPFDLQALQPNQHWFTLDRHLCGELPIMGVQSLLASEDVPHIPVHDMTISEIYGGQSVLASRLRAPSEFFFEILWLLQRARAEMAAAQAAAERLWRCAACGEENPGNFELCWNCQQPR